jgi:type VI secretion system protein ImpF
MAGQKNERIAPPLMHAFRAAHLQRDAKTRLDIRDQGERVIASRRPLTSASISERDLRKLVDMDLVTLFNTTNLDSIEDLKAVPEVQRSVLNFGFPDLARRTIDENGLHDIAREIEGALANYEPRLAKNTIKAERDMTAQPEELKLRFLVKADLVTQPVDVPVEFVAEVEIDSGKIKIGRL